VLTTYAQRCCTFNDDMQGTAAVVLAAALAAVRSIHSRMRDQRIVIHGAGTAGIGIADMLRDAMVADGLTPAEATGRIFALGSRGLLTTDQASTIRDFQLPYARTPEETAGWAKDGGAPSLADVVREVSPTMLIGTSAQPAAFTEAIVRDMVANTARPIVMPLSNPTSKCEALPGDLIRWTDGAALVATGSPFPAVEHAGVTHTVAQANNALIFPGLGLGVIASRASRVSDGMLMAAAQTLADIAPSSGAGASLLPPVTDLRAVSAAVAASVAKAAAREGLARTPLTDPVQQIHEAMWRPSYPQVQAI
jgi:malate dehydrogenase (oxaloacetate-decarboxylating)